MVSTTLAPQPIAPGRPVLVTAYDDNQAAAVWLAEYQQAPRTLASYRKETERFMLWLAERGLKLADLKREDVLAYQQFLADPQPAWRWVGPSIARQHKDWKPFTGPLSPASIRHALTVLGALYSYLNHAGYLQGNPFKLRKSRSPRIQTQGIERYLTEDAWLAVLQTLEQLPREKPRDQDHAERARWLLSLAYLTGARRSEMADAKMGDWFERRGRWWWRVEGKGGVLADIPVSDDLLRAMERYRKHLGLSLRPIPGESTPLICRVTGEGDKRFAALSDKAIYLIIKTIFQRAGETVADPALQQLFKQASPHWLRHTAASHQLEAGVPLLLVSQNLRHASLQTTRRYLHSEDDARHEATRHLKLQLPDEEKP